MVGGERPAAKRFGIFLYPGAAPNLEMIVRAEALGVSAVWVGTGAAAPDGLTLLAAAAVRTNTIRLGAAIVPALPRHPIVTVQQAEVIASLAPGRFVLGLGTGHEPSIAGEFGLSFERPLEHLREYVTIVKAALHTGQVSHEGARYRVHASVPLPAPVPVMISALHRNSFLLAGAVADGAISWITPALYLRRVALPALEEGAIAAGRPVPPLIAHCFVGISEDEAEVRRVAHSYMRRLLSRPFYRRVLVAAGYPQAVEGKWTDEMLDAVVVRGSENAVGDGLRSFAATAGASELMISPLPMADNLPASAERLMRLVAAL